MRFLCALLAFALTACGRADARETNTPSLTVEYMQGDSARVIARWSRPCDAKGCADSYEVAWWRGAGTFAPIRTLTRTTDTLRLARPAIGDSAIVEVIVTSVRRKLAGQTRSARVVVRNPDAPPPPVDSLRADTTDAAYEAAMLDSFPEIVIRDSLGRTGYNGYRVGDTIVLCAMSRNRYTGEVRSLIQADAPPGADEETDEACAHARALYAAERSG